MVTFHGERVRGKYVLFRTGGKNWMIHRMDPPEDPDREPMPEKIEPMLAPHGQRCRPATNWAYEIKWDGVRAIGYAEGGRLRLESRNGNNITPRYPELRALGRALGTHEAILDGEVVALRRDGRPSFQRLQRRMHLTSRGQVRRLRAVRAGRLHDLRPAVARRALAAGADLRGPPRAAGRARAGRADLAGARPPRRQRRRRCWRPPRPRASRASWPSGCDCPYIPGRRSQGWVKVKNVRNTDVVVGGWVGRRRRPRRARSARS